MTTSPTGSGGRLTGSLGPGAIVFMVVAAAAPLTVVAGTVPIGIAAGNGASFPATYVVCTLVLLLFAVGFTAMTKHVRSGGAFSTYIARGLGRPAGVGAALLAVVSYATIQLAVYGFIGAATGALVTGHGGPDLPWPVWSLLVLAVVGVLGYRHIDLSGKVLGVLLVAEVAVVLVMDVVIVARGGGSSEGLATAAFSPTSFTTGAPGIALIFAVAGYIGFEATAIFRDEARDPDRTVPRATYAALLVIGVFYAFSAWALVSWWGDAGAVARAAADPGTMVSETATLVLGSAVGDVVEVLLVTSVFAAILSFHNVLSRYLFTLGDPDSEVAVLPAGLARAHSKHASPHVASVATTVIGLVLLAGCAVAGLDPVNEIFTWFAGMAVVGLLALMLLTSLAALVFFSRHRGLAPAWSGLVAPTLAVVGLGVLVVMTLDNLTLLVGGSSTVAAVFEVVLAGSFLVGAVVAGLPPVTNAVTSTTAPLATDPLTQGETA
ncbi:APC family permease [Nocardioides bruguierae]|uniref:APC family permease n=1 Tax=Nocardioides bruguierae TaxID=2945102 RepID=A0A9X2D8E8_9ACTN|nr:APC family permease [Nocardioides bruguierae]MCM0621065.1 APC family permease [Nocardioides bruguierae]